MIPFSRITVNFQRFFDTNRRLNCCLECFTMGSFNDKEHSFVFYLNKVHEETKETIALEFLYKGRI